MICLSRRSRVELRGSSDTGGSGIEVDTKSTVEEARTRMAVESSEPTVGDRFKEDDSTVCGLILSPDSRTLNAGDRDRSSSRWITSPSTVNTTPMKADCKTRNTTLHCTSAAARRPTTAIPAQIVRNRMPEKMAKKPTSKVSPEQIATSQGRETTQTFKASGCPATAEQVAMSIRRVRAVELVDRRRGTGRTDDPLVQKGHLPPGTLLPDITIPVPLILVGPARWNAHQFQVPRETDLPEHRQDDATIEEPRRFPAGALALPARLVFQLGEDGPGAQIAGKAQTVARA